jgi:hypothetical protein
MYFYGSQACEACHALALCFVFNKFCRVHKALGATPAMAAGIVDRIMHMKDVVGLIGKKACRSWAL